MFSLGTSFVAGLYWNNNDDDDGGGDVLAFAHVPEILPACGHKTGCS